LGRATPPLASGSKNGRGNRNENTVLGPLPRPADAGGSGKRFWESIRGTRTTAEARRWGRAALHFQGLGKRAECVLRTALLFLP